MATARKYTTSENQNPNDPDAHKVGGSLGMTAGGVAGAAVGAVAGPIGLVAGAAVGGALGGKAGEAVAREVNPTEEEKYWETNYRNRPYARADRDFEAYRPAYRYGIDSYNRFEGKNFAEIEAELNRDWPQRRGTSSLEWNEARGATEDAYTRLSTRLRQDDRETR